MGRRKLRDIYKMQILSVKRKAKKDKVNAQVPTFKNLEIDYSRTNDKNINIVVTDILNATEKNYKTVVLATDKKGSTFIVKKIRCPICKATLVLNEHWQCFICQQNEQHPKKCFEIQRVL